MAFGVADGIEKANKVYDVLTFLGNDDRSGHLYSMVVPGKRLLDIRVCYFLVNPEGLKDIRL